jgi:hypothetical protein
MSGASDRPGGKPQERRPMSRFAVPAIIVSIIVFALAVVGYLLGVGFLPTMAESVEKGTVAPYRIVWGMIWIVEACTIALGVSLLRHGIKGLSSH